MNPTVGKLHPLTRSTNRRRRQPHRLSRGSVHPATGRVLPATRSVHRRHLGLVNRNLDAGRWLLVLDGQDDKLQGLLRRRRRDCDENPVLNDRHRVGGHRSKEERFGDGEDVYNGSDTFKETVRKDGCDGRVSEDMLT
jgi:hypothetical protein